MHPVNLVPKDRVKSRTEFLTDLEFQQYYRALFLELGLDDGYAHTINETGLVVHRGGMKMEPEKISKSQKAP